MKSLEDRLEDEPLKMLSYKVWVKRFKENVREKKLADWTTSLEVSTSERRAKA